MAFQAEETHAGTDVKSFWKQYRLFHAAAAQCASPHSPLLYTTKLHQSATPAHKSPSQEPS